MGARLDSRDGAPSVSPEALLRALRVASPGEGLDYEALARLVVVGADYSSGSAEPAYPEATWGGNAIGTVPSGGANRWAGFRVTAGPRGLWIAAHNNGTNYVTTFLLDAAGMSLWLANLWWIDGVTQPFPDTTCNGFDPGYGDAYISTGWVTNTGPGSGQPGMRIGDTNVVAAHDMMRDPLWIPPGCTRFYVDDTQAQTLLNEGVWARAPLSAP